MIQSPYIDRRRGFTLLELLAVMAIMLIMATITITGYNAMMSGVGTGSAITHLRQTMQLARQSAILKGQSTFVIFDQKNGTNGWYTTCAAQGYNSSSDNLNVMDLYNGDIKTLVPGGTLFNLSEEAHRSSVIKEVQPDAFTCITEAPGIWSNGCRYGWEISQRLQLPRGYRFTEDPPPTIQFKPNGTVVDWKNDRVAKGVLKITIKDEKSGDEYSIQIDYDGSMKIDY